MKFDPIFCDLNIICKRLSALELSSTNLPLSRASFIPMHRSEHIFQFTMPNESKRNTKSNIVLWNDSPVFYSIFDKWNVWINRCSTKWHAPKTLSNNPKTFSNTFAIFFFGRIYCAFINNESVIGVQFSKHNSDNIKSYFHFLSFYIENCAASNCSIEQQHKSGERTSEWTGGKQTNEKDSKQLLGRN